VAAPRPWQCAALGNDGSEIWHLYRNKSRKRSTALEALREVQEQRRIGRWNRGVAGQRGRLTALFRGVGALLGGTVAETGQAIE